MFVLILYCKQMSFFKIRNCKNAIIATLDICKHEIQHNHMYHHIPSNPWQNTAAQAWLTWSSCRLFVPDKKKDIVTINKIYNYILLRSPSLGKIIHVHVHKTFKMNFKFESLIIEKKKQHN